MRYVPGPTDDKGSALWLIAMWLAIQMLAWAIWLYRKAGRKDLANALSMAGRFDANEMMRRGPNEWAQSFITR